MDKIPAFAGLAKAGFCYVCELRIRFTLPILKIPNYKHQIPNKFQFKNSNL